jgi:hypothetical protein
VGRKQAGAGLRSLTGGLGLAVATLATQLRACSDWRHELEVGHQSPRSVSMQDWHGLRDEVKWLVGAVKATVCRKVDATRADSSFKAGNTMLPRLSFVISVVCKRGKSHG